MLKEPKYYFYDTGAVEGDFSAKLENVVALAVLRELHFLAFLKDVKPIQLVYSLKRKKSTRTMQMLPVQEFLADINFMR